MRAPVAVRRPRDQVCGMGRERLELGAMSEEVATRYLLRRGWRVLARNWRCRAGEIDIVALDPAGAVVVCEVKARRGVGWGTPLEAITTAKARRLRRLAAAWAQAEGCPRTDLRCDAIGVLWRGDGTASIEHVVAVEP